MISANSYGQDTTEEMNLVYAKAIQAVNSKNYDTAISLLTELSNNGHAKSIDALGQCYENGLGVPVDFNIARKLYQEAWKKRLSIAAVHLGYIYDKGLGVPINKKTAGRLFEEAMHAGEPYGYFALAGYYADGIGYTKNLQTAKRFLQIAVSKGLNPEIAEDSLSVINEMIAKEDEQKNTFKSDDGTVWTSIGVMGRPIFYSLANIKNVDGKRVVKTVTHVNYRFMPGKGGESVRVLSKSQDLTVNCVTNITNLSSYTYHTLGMGMGEIVEEKNQDKVSQSLGWEYKEIAKKMCK